jgi:hypothetical protein
MGACERCGTPFAVTQPLKRFCSERCRRAVANRRYRAHRTESHLPSLRNAVRVRHDHEAQADLLLARVPVRGEVG